MKLLSTTPKSVSSYAMLKNLERFKIPPMTESWVRQQGHRPLLFLKEKEAKSGHVKLMSRNIPVSSVCFSSTVHPPASGDPSQPMNPVTSALISGVVILGGVSVGFFLLSLHLLQRSRLPSTTASGVWNPSFK